MRGLLSEHAIALVEGNRPRIAEVAVAIREAIARHDWNCRTNARGGASEETVHRPIGRCTSESTSRSRCEISSTTSYPTVLNHARTLLHDRRLLDGFMLAFEPRVFGFLLLGSA